MWSRKDNLLTLKMSLLALGRASATAFPVLLDWAFDNSSTCSEAANRPDFGCVSKHSECLNSTGSANGYVCRCRLDYHGNPYVPDGCQRRRSHFRAGKFQHFCMFLVLTGLNDDFFCFGLYGPRLCTPRLIYNLHRAPWHLDVLCLSPKYNLSGFQKEDVFSADF